MTTQNTNPANDFDIASSRELMRASLAALRASREVIDSVTDIHAFGIVAAGHEITRTLLRNGATMEQARAAGIAGELAGRHYSGMVIGTVTALVTQGTKPDELYRELTSVVGRKAGGEIDLCIVHVLEVPTMEHLQNHGGIGWHGGTIHEPFDFVQRERKKQRDRARQLRRAA
ncbi:MAG: hypothetical protein KKF85_02685 [Gammaproteobacteria bacterium]|nr:hypothetical protein [Rhodocyclaceae bacterium]MBU3908733.1 hypothetical protein [Gammaproteobacteria bacterium]MBU3988855.1 hypothetical protein [Gammaproteobacteria bacterium]MBU4004761.1 hypothetical protein [Gammaproteobacteria bacterium]MBU4021364.1 hypothetical protein [Gammaproteobacteria bacterium]